MNRAQVHIAVKKARLRSNFMNRDLSNKNFINKNK